MANLDPPSTSLFKRCRGVFQGGGCRAVAHIGAYQAARESGIELVQVAGSSAGSLVATLIGAGASPQYLLDHLAELRFLDLLQPPEGVFRTRFLTHLARTLLSSTSSRMSSIGKILLLGGRYSSRGIEAWIDDRLADLLPDASRPVRFSDLRLPTWVVASDLSAGRTKVWSTSATPDTPVRFAVRCSCSIPLFFEPVAEGTNLYADGGLLSNLPAFVFSDHSADRSRADPILAFCLTDDSPPVREWSLTSLSDQLLNTALSGSLDIQTFLQREVSMITIPTLGVKATDFDLSSELITSLLDSGRQATLSFVRDEPRRSRRGKVEQTAANNEEEFYDTLVREAIDIGDELTVSCRNTKWYWRLFPTVAAWRATGAHVTVVVPPTSGDSYVASQERQRRDNMKALGTSLCETNALGTEVFILGRRDRNQQAAFVLKSTDNDLTPFATVYVGSAHTAAILSLRQAVRTNSPQVAASRIALRASDPGPVIHRLKQGVRQYDRESVGISVERVQTSSVQLIVRRIRPHKFLQIDLLKKLYAQSELPVFSCAEFECHGNPASVVTPPVVEVWNDRMIVVEGNTRFLNALRSGISEVTAFVVRGVEDPLPGQPVPIQDVVFASPHDSPTDRIMGFDHGKFRSIERAARPLDVD